VNGGIGRILTLGNATPRAVVVTDTLNVVVLPDVN
jgi:hypothetical protein